MRRTTPVILLPLVVLFTLSGDISCADDEGSFSIPIEGVHEVYSEEAKKIKEEIKQQVDVVETRFDEDAEALLEDNSLLDALQRYKTVYQSAKGTSCEGEEPPEISQDYLIEEINKCDSAVPKEMLDVYYDNLKSADFQVDTIDASLRSTDETCEENANCQDMKRTALEQLNNVFSLDVQAAFARDFLNIEEQFKVNLKNCFDDNVKEAREEIDEATEVTNNCLKNPEAE